MAIDDDAERQSLCAPARSVLAGLTLPFQDFLDTIPAGALVVDAQGRIVAVNVELARQFGYEERSLLGHAVELLVPTGLRGGHAAMRDRPFGAGQNRAMGAGRPLLGQRKNGSVFPIEVGLRGLPVGEGQFVLAIVSDRSDHIRAKTSEAQEKALGLELAHQEVVAREMGHRIKNLMATVSALISLSARGAQSPKAMEDSLRGRILALSSVIDLAFKAPQAAPTHGALALENILHAVLAPFQWADADSERVALSGPWLAVGQRPAEVLALVFYELATNALKYGALRQPDGRIFVDWRLVDGHLALHWRETAPQFYPSAPDAEGFGTTLMSRLIEIEFGGGIEREVTPAGWTTHLTIPLKSLGL